MSSGCWAMPQSIGRDMATDPEMRRPAGLARWVAAGFGSGFAPVAPGTFGSLAGLAIGGGVLLWTGQAAVGGLGLLGAALVASAAGWWAIPRASDGEDHGWIVIDEIAGQLLAMVPLAGLGLGPGAVGALAAFLLFRLFDITKPGPIGWADRQHGPGGIMGDDLLAGLAAGVLTGLLRWAWEAAR